MQRGQRAPIHALARGDDVQWASSPRLQSFRAGLALLYFGCDGILRRL
jgi:hypothetical protein